MLLSSVTLVLQETLEATLLISLLLAISYQRWHRLAWLGFGICGGVVLSFLYSGFMPEISAWFDYVGQEIVNAALQLLSGCMIVICTWVVYKNPRTGAGEKRFQDDPFASTFMSCAALAVALSITREGSEISLYLNGFFQQSEHFQTVMVGSCIGFSIGLSTGVLIYYGLSGLPARWRLDVPIVLMALFTGNMFSQAALQLTQADWISSSQAFWDTSGFLPESSILGRTLYALVGYEATPSVAQLMAYGAGVLLVLVSRSLARPTESKKPVARGGHRQ